MTRRRQDEQSVSLVALEGLEGRLLLSGGPVINEFLALNDPGAPGLADGDGDFSDWIEIHNPTPLALSLEGWHLTDDSQDPARWTFPAVTLPAGGYLVVFASGKARLNPAQELHTNFRLDGDGEYLALVEPNGATIAQEFAPQYPSQPRGVSYGLADPGDPLSTRYFLAPTPGQANGQGVLGFVQPVQFSRGRGFYDPGAPGFDLTLWTDTAEAQIRYTLDGAAPTADGGTVYDASIRIDRTTTLRAAAFRAGYEPSDVVCQTYIFLADVYAQTCPDGYPQTWGGGYAGDYEMDPEIYNDPAYADLMAEAMKSLPVVSIVTDADALFDPATGIYMNSTQEGDEWERAVSVEFFQDSLGDQFQINCGLRIQGGASREPAKCPKHSLRLLFKSEYGPATLDFPLFGRGAADEFDTVVLRGGFNNSWLHWDGSQRDRAQYLRDEWIRMTQLAMGAPSAHGRFVHVYINGMYWGMYDLTERPSAPFAAEYFGGEKEDYDVLNGGEVVEGDRVAWDAMMALANAGLAGDASYQAIQQYLDVDNLIDYMILNFYGGNWDWDSHNWYAARKREDGAQFRFFSWDSERILEGVNDNLLGVNNNGCPSRLFQKLCQNAQFRERFADAVQEHFFGDGALTPEAAAKRWSDLADQIDLAAIAESARWGDYRRDVHSWSSGPYELYTRNDQWLTEQARLLNDYFPARTAAVLQQFRSAGLYPDVAAPEMLINGAVSYGGAVAPGDLLSLFCQEAPAGQVYYTLDGTDPRLPDGSVAPGAISFTPGSSSQVTLVSAWATWRYLDNGSDQGTAWRGTSFNDGAWAAGDAQLGYGDGDEATVVSYGPNASNKYVTTYFRHAFDVANPNAVTELTIRLLRDDGAVAYLNGTEIPRSNMPDGTIGYDTLASSTIGGADESTFYEFTVSPRLLVAGQNVLAVEVHQGSLSSSDMSFNCELVGTVVGGDPPIAIVETTRVRARVLDGGEWSAIAEAVFRVPSSLAITEINYHPVAPTAEEITAGFTSADDFEFLELWNYGSAAIDLRLLRFDDGIDFDFAAGIPPGATLVPGQYALVVRNLAAFEFRYGAALGPLVAGEFTGSLDDNGETLRLLQADEPFIEFTYADSGSWPSRPDSQGSSLELADPAGTAAGAYGQSFRWRASAEYGGTPGAAGAGPMGDVVINEVLARPDGNDTDAIELYNASGQSVAVGGWYLTDCLDELRKFRIPPGTSIPAGGYLVFTEYDFNPTGGLLPTDFALGAAGDSVWLVEADADPGAPRLLRFVDHVKFGDSPAGLSYARWPNATGELAVASGLTLGQANAHPLNRGIVINEIHYDPAVKTELVEFVELYNAGGAAVDLSGWYFDDGVAYTFPAGASLAAGAYLLVADHPAAVLAKFGKTALGPWDGQFDNDGERIVLRDAAGNKQDEVDYKLGFPWPTVGDAPGRSIELVGPLLDNDLGGNWRSSVAGPTPGAANSVLAANAAPQMRQVDHSPTQPATGQEVTVTVKVTDPDGVAAVTLAYQLVDAGDYISIGDPRYATQWTGLAMHDDGLAGDEQAGDDVYTVVLPAAIQVHRRLVRYRITATDALGASVTGPYDDDPQPNFAYYVYDGMVAWRGAAQPGVTPEVVYGPELLESVPVYQLLTTREAHEQSQAIPDSAAGQYWGEDYPWVGTFIYDGVVYDHIHFRARGGCWRYSMGKNMWKFDFNQGHGFQAKDAYGREYDVTWDKVNFSAIIQQGDYLHRGEQGLFEAVGAALFNLAGVECPDTYYAHFRIVQSADEYGPTQYDGDFQGVYLVMEQPDGRLLDEHGLEDGNLYKMEGGTGTLNNQGPTQPSDGSDLNAFMSAYNAGASESWWRQNVNLDEYYSYRAIVESIHHYDIGYGKNYFYYHDPETDQWSVLPWDLDLTWANNMYGNGEEPFKSRLLSQPVFALEYRNRMREIRDLLYNPEQAGMLINEMASMVYTPGPGAPGSLVDADRAMWDYNPILVSGYTNPSKAGNGRFYRITPTHDFAGMIQLMKDYVVSRGAWIDTQILTDESLVPHKPTLSYAGVAGFPADCLAFRTSGFASSHGSFAAVEWRIAEVTDSDAPGFDPFERQPRLYEIQATWESGELTAFDDTMSVPAESLQVGRTYRARVRVKDDAGRWSHWSAPVEVLTTAPLNATPEILRITEVMYNPPAPSPQELAVNPHFDNDDFEFIELHNTSGEPLSLAGLQSNKVLTLTAGPGAPGVLPGGGYAVLVRNLAAFRARYGPEANVIGTFDKKLNNDGDEIELFDNFGRQVSQFEYADDGAWPGRADGKGSSLVVVDTSGDYEQPGNWASSVDYAGSPGAPGSTPLASIVINEVLTHTDLPDTDAIELHNTTAHPIDIGGWYLSDSSGNYRKFRIPDGTTVPAGGYVVFRETQFNPGGGQGEDDFALDCTYGDDVWLLTAGAIGGLGQFVDHVEFGAARNGESFGRWPDAAGDLTPTSAVTLGAANAYPRVGPVVISEVFWANDTPGEADLEFIEIQNTTDSSVDLTGWRIRGDVDFNFASGPGAPGLAPAGMLLVLSFDPALGANADRAAAFRAFYGLDGSLPLVGGYAGLLGNGRNVRLQQPDGPPAENPQAIPYLLEDEVAYADLAPWPDGTEGLSLNRKRPEGWGNGPAEWIAQTPTPGWVLFDPVANAGADQDVLDADGDWYETVTLDGAVSRYLARGGSYTWSENPGAPGLATGAHPNVRLAVGVHTITLSVVGNTGAADTDTVEVTVAPVLGSAPLVLISPIEASEVQRGQAYAVTWFGGQADMTVRILSCGPTGFHTIAQGLPGNDGKFLWDSTDAGGWNTFLAEVNDGGQCAWTRSPNWVRVCEAPPQPLGAPATAPPGETSTDLRVLAPSPGEQFVLGGTLTVRWSVEAPLPHPTEVFLWVYCQASGQWALGAGPVEAASQQIPWDLSGGAWEPGQYSLQLRWLDEDDQWRLSPDVDGLEVVLLASP